VTTKARAFYVHYSKPASAREKRNVLVVHYDKQCIPVFDVDIRVPIKSRTRKTQPKCVLAGKGVVRVVNNVAVITEK
jgi:hypothetical protein